MRRRIKLVPQIGLLGINDVVENQMPFIERIVCAGKLDGSNAILVKKFFQPLGIHNTSTQTLTHASASDHGQAG